MTTIRYRTQREVKAARLKLELENHVRVFEETDALEVLVELAARLRGGHLKYGPLDLATDPRDWPVERLAESKDRLIYDVFEDLARVKKGAQG